MASRKPADIEGALLRKGFVLDDSKDHRYLYLWVNGRRTSVRTKVSHARADYGDGLLGMVQRQLRLTGDKRVFNGLLDCPVTAEEYVAHLLRRGEISLGDAR